MDSGTLDAYIINQLKMAHREDDLRKFLALNNRLEIVGLLLGSSFGWCSLSKHWYQYLCF
ncbi:hypothetical protein [Streptococcus gallolyticus]|uniref:hypothetical protein n=1 Tax=Streptococcus gallolyticus TaxID=315405 RepID=UPI000B24448F|nr:hypothetical protein [Streptococcus gallolyticus]